MNFSRKNSVNTVAYGGLLVAFLAVSAQLSVPLPFTGIPITMQTFVLLFIGGLLSPKTSGLVTAVYLLLGMVGVPVFASFSGGIQVFARPSGGFLLAFLPGVMLFSYLLKMQSIPLLPRYLLALISFHFLLFSFGTLWFIWLTSSQLLPALSLCVLPFLPGDLLKAVGFCVVFPKVEQRLSYLSFSN